MSAVSHSHHRLEGKKKDPTFSMLELSLCPGNEDFPPGSVPFSIFIWLLNFQPCLSVSFLCLSPPGTLCRTRTLFPFSPFPLPLLSLCQIPREQKEIFFRERERESYGPMLSTVLYTHVVYCTVLKWARGGSRLQKW